MKHKDLMRAAKAAEKFDAISKFEVMDIASISVKANPFVTEALAGQGRASAVQLAIFPGDPAWDPLMTLISARVQEQKTLASDELLAAGITPTVDKAELEAIVAETANGKAKLEEAKAAHDAVRAKKEAGGQ